VVSNNIGWEATDVNSKNNGSKPILEGRSVTKYFGGLAALLDVDFTLYPGEIVGLIGPNGSGKTTLFDWLARTFQVIRVYRKLTVLENMLLSRQWRGEGLFNQLRPSQPDTEARARQLIDFLLLDHLVEELAGNLSGGQQRLLEIGMSLMPDPDLILLDEATSGVLPTLVETIKDRIRRLNREQGKTFLLVEHNIQFIADLCSRVFVLNYGQKLAEGTPAEIVENEAVLEAYFGS
jgi:ABC-type branched-subunit amino acid transport system ATPase component